LTAGTEEELMALTDTGRLEATAPASAVTLLVGVAFTSVPEESQPLPDSYGTGNSVLWWFLALLAFCVVAMLGDPPPQGFAVRSTGGRQRWLRVPVVTVIVLALLALLAPLVVSASLVVPAPLALPASLIAPAPAADCTRLSCRQQ
jgi:hypothetical protein